MPDTYADPTGATDTHRLLSDTDIDQRVAFCHDLVRRAGELAKQGFETARTNTFKMKGPQDYLTETDLAVENLIRGEISARYPNDGFLGEETGGDVSDPYWVVDPIDGTENFSRGIPHYCIVMAFISAGTIEFGAVYDPSHDELYFARSGRGATLNENPISVSKVERYDEATIETGWSKRRSNSEFVSLVSQLLDAGTSVRRAASGALGLSYVASGRTEAYTELHMNAWDCLAGLLLVREAGGVVGELGENGALHKGGTVLAATPHIADLISQTTGIPIASPTG